MWPSENPPRRNRDDDWFARRARCLEAFRSEARQQGTPADLCADMAAPSAAETDAFGVHREHKPMRPGESRVISLGNDPSTSLAPSARIGKRGPSAASQDAAPWRAHRMRSTADRARMRARIAAWFIAPFALSAVAAGFGLVRAGLIPGFALACGALLAAGLGWVLVSALLPGKVDRACPQCKRPGVEPLGARSSTGVWCTLCGWRDASASAFLFLEEQGPFEDVVLRERQQRRR